ncbi:MAG: hypothetical protein IPM52_09420 [Bacteroidetes bacterium]|nr:hypothetical protein [Bacteroidota bacterium]
MNLNKTLLKHLLGELPASRRKVLEQKLAEDPALRRQSAAWQRVMTCLLGYQPDFAAGFEQRVFQRLASQHLMVLQEHRLWLTMLRFSLTAAAAVVLLIVWVYFQEQSLSLEHLLGLAGLKTDDFANLLANY